MSKVVLISGASSGFGAMSARLLADAGHTVYATMRDVAGNNAEVVADYAAYARERKWTCVPSRWTSAARIRSTRRSLRS